MPEPGPPADEAARLAELEQVFRALAHASRRHVLLVLHFRGGEMGAGDIAGRFACSWPTTSRHLAVLRDAGLVSVQRRGRERVYVLDRERLRRTVGDWLAWFDSEPLADAGPSAGTPARLPEPPEPAPTDAPPR